MKGGDYIMANSVEEIPMLKRKNVLMTKMSTRRAIDALNSILAQIEADDGSFIDLKDLPLAVTNVVMGVAALNTMNDHDV